MKARIHKIEARTLVDGPGERTAVFFQGCPLGCAGCQNKHIWPFDGGTQVEVKDLAETLVNLNSQYTISGGEPFAQPAALAELVWRLRWTGDYDLLSNRHIIVFTGYTWEELMNPSHPAYPYLKTIYENIDVLVDGRFVRELDDPYITYRGSRNQRVIDVFETLSTGEICTLDWDNEIVLDVDGSLLMPVGFAQDFEEVGQVESNRKCGQTRF